jgi:hypothetical protein
LEPELIQDVNEACSYAKGKLEKYYNLQSDLAIASAVLDPRLNCRYYEEEKLSEAENTLKRMEAFKETQCWYFASYAPKSVDVSNGSELEEGKLDNGPGMLKRRVYYRKFSRNIRAKNSCELETYCFDTDLAHPDVDPLQWWSTNQAIFPNLSLMARDILAIPATSTTSERAFSSAGAIQTKIRNRMSPKTLEACCIHKEFLRSKSII